VIRRPALALAAGLVAAAVPAPGHAELPDAVRLMIESAFRTNDPNAIAAVVRAAKDTNPEAGGEIDTMVNSRLARLALAVEAQREGASFFEYVKGNIEAGASLQSGNTSSTGIYGSIALTQNSPHWRHQLSARADYLRTNGVTTVDRLRLAYEPNYKFDDRLYLFGLAQYERDPILGFRSRFTGGGGLGYTVVAEPDLRVDVTGGPVVRHTDYVFMPNEDAVAGRATLTARWVITPVTTFTQDAQLYVETGQTSANATSSLDTQLIGQLKARLSFNVLYEQDAPAGADSVDTISRATLLYSF
jgi:putative salt-induced outer membrane protein